MPKSAFFRSAIQSHIFGTTDLSRPNAYFLNVYSIDPGVNLTWDIPAPLFTPYQVNSFTVTDNQVRIVDEITLGPIPVGQTLPVSNFALFGRYGNPGNYTYKPLHIGGFRVTRNIPEGDFVLFRSNSIVITEL